MQTRDPDTRAVDFDEYRDNYREAVEDALSFSGEDVDHFAEVKARHLVELVRDRIGDPAGMSALDVGCGVGVTDGYLVPEFRELRGVDVAPGVIDRARVANPGAEYDVYDGTHLPYEDDSFDVSFAICAMHHVDPVHWLRFAAELGRVTRPGGLAVVFEHNPWSPLTRRVVSNCEFDEDAVLLSASRLQSIYRHAGVDVVERRFVFFPARAERLIRLERGLGRLPLGAQYYVAGSPGSN